MRESEQYFVDKAGNQTTAKNSVGRKCKTKVTHPNWILHDNEAGTELCQESDRHIGGQTYLVVNGKRATIKCIADPVIKPLLLVSSPAMAKL